MISDRGIAENYFKKYLLVLVLRAKNNRGAEQRQISEKLYMNEASYSDIETALFRYEHVTDIFLLNTESGQHLV